MERKDAKAQRNPILEYFAPLRLCVRKYFAVRDPRSAMDATPRFHERKTAENL